jgi:hypothetical protein
MDSSDKLLLKHIRDLLFEVEQMYEDHLKMIGKEIFMNETCIKLAMASLALTAEYEGKTEDELVKETV